MFLMKVRMQLSLEITQVSIVLIGWGNKSTLGKDCIETSWIHIVFFPLFDFFFRTFALIDNFLFDLLVNGLDLFDIFSLM